MKSGLEVILRVTLNGTKTVFFNPFAFSESVHVIRTQINLSRFSLPACAFLFFDRICAPLIIASNRLQNTSNYFQLSLIRQTRQEKGVNLLWVTHCNTCKFGREETRELTSGLHPNISTSSRKAGNLETTRTLNILPWPKPTLGWERGWKKDGHSRFRSRSLTRGGRKGYQVF